LDLTIPLWHIEARAIVIMDNSLSRWSWLKHFVRADPPLDRIEFATIRERLVKIHARRRGGHRSYRHSFEGHSAWVVPGWAHREFQLSNADRSPEKADRLPSFVEGNS
jgi:hypothetical protein